MQWVTETEPEYDINERDNWYALAEYEEALCQQCGRLRSICEDPTQSWFPQRYWCGATAAGEVARRRFQRKHEKAKTDEAGYLPSDGVTVWVAPEDVVPGDDFLD